MVKLFLDAGHGGKDSGAVGLGLKEKDLTLKIVKKIGVLLGDYDDVQVLYSRTGDTYPTLSERAAMANKAKADYFVSVHINATPSGTGFETFAYNSVSSKTVAYQNVMHGEIKKAMGNVRDRGKKRGNLAVLRETCMPAILTENLFIDNPGDNKLLKQDSFLDKVAQGHVNGFVKMLGLKKKATVKQMETKTAAKQKSDGKLHKVQVGAFSDPKNAEKLAEELKKKGYNTYIVKE
ncbi:N-acetylmuramoyl-L-alanine amidase [Neobacillus mesonae]|uniref:N-acetylmuramoyl-L-alanine amidase n=1 Tax=Neobacillus mesonae TaxID=1193713 RepID=UPI00203E6657|nr:N-acetylmuramoyl-L-alanine amidase [Neobacillus mesonae]MCM3567834.1 N-acetylmuramoyl-L-alanine amidase [Neobacillus mesonae]